MVVVIFVVVAVVLDPLSADWDRVDSIGRIDHNDAPSLDGIEGVGQRFFERQTIGDDQHGTFHCLAIAERCFERMRVPAERNDCLDFSKPVTRDIGRNVSPDAGGRDNLGSLVLARCGCFVASTGSQRDRSQGECGDWS